VYEIKEGDRVHIIGQDGNGVVLSVKGNTATVQFGVLKSVINLSKLEKSGKTSSKEKEIENGTANKEVYVQTKDGTSILAFNSGKICPPYCTEIGDDSGGFGFILIDKGNEGLCVV